MGITFNRFAGIYRICVLGSQNTLKSAADQRRVGGDEPKRVGQPRKAISVFRGAERDASRKALVRRFSETARRGKTVDQAGVLLYSGI